jgi:hypothetical protein
MHQNVCHALLIKLVGPLFKVLTQLFGEILPKTG